MTGNLGAGRKHRDPVPETEPPHGPPEEVGPPHARIEQHHRGCWQQEGQREAGNAASRAEIEEVLARPEDGTEPNGVLHMAGDGTRSEEAEIGRLLEDVEQRSRQGTGSGLRRGRWGG